MPVATIETKSVQIDDDLTDLSWLIQMNSNNNHHQNKQRHTSSNEYKQENKTSKIERTNKPLAVVNGQTIRPAIPIFSHDDQYFNEENQQFYSRQSFNNQTMKRKYDPSLSYHHHHHHHHAKRFHSEQTLPMYSTPPLPSDSFYFDHPPLPPPPPTQQRTSIPTTSRYMLLKNDPTLSETIPTVPMSTNYNEPIQMIEHTDVYSDDIEHLLDIFKNEVEMSVFDPVASTSTGDCAIDMGHCLSSNEFCSY